jgi:hypothetical protein
MDQIAVRSGRVRQRGEPSRHVSEHTLVDKLCAACEVPWIKLGHAQTLCSGKANVAHTVVDCEETEAKRGRHKRVAHRAIPQQIQIDGMPALTNT